VIEPCVESQCRLLDFKLGGLKMKAATCQKPGLTSCQFLCKKLATSE
jgi:hypothetical protein